MLFSNVIEEIKHLRSLLELERAEELRLCEELINTSSLAQRRSAGLCWYPVVIAEENMTAGSQYLLSVQTNLNKNQTTYKDHQFAAGLSAALFSNAGETGNKNERLFIQGVIRKIKNETIQLLVKSKEDLPDWIYEGKLGLDLLYDETSYKEMDIALHKVLKARGKDRLVHLSNIMLGYKKPKFDTLRNQFYNDKLNASQNKALQKVLEAEEVAIIHGPPGTGKTTILVECVVQVLKKEKQVLVVAPSNTAVDLLAQKLIDKGLNVLRLGHPARIDEDLQTHTFDYQLTQHSHYKHIKDMKKEAQTLRNKAQKFKRNFGEEERTARRENYKAARQLLDDVRTMEQQIEKDVLAQTQVVTATLVGAALPVLHNTMFSTVFIDEAAQALEPACWIPITRAEKVVLAGDHWQLPPTVKSMEAQKEGLLKSLFEKTIDRIPEAAVMLQTQYRMNEQIMAFPAQWFYNNELKAANNVKKHTLHREGVLLNRPFDFIDTAGCGFEEEQEPDSLSTRNPQEADLAFKYLEMMYEEMENLYPGLCNQTSLGIIAPYKAQVRYLQDRLTHSPISAYEKNISIHTVDGFQGQERDIIAICMTRSNENGNIGFLNDLRRTNVAMTRARKKLILIGDSATLANHDFYKQLLDFAEKTNAYKSAWEFMY